MSDTPTGQPTPLETQAFHALERLPEGTQFGTLILIPNRQDPAGEGRVLAMTTDRTKVAVGAAQWVMDVLRPEPPSE